MPIPRKCQAAVPGSANVSLDPEAGNSPIGPGRAGADRDKVYGVSTSKYIKRSKGSATALETVTVAAGTFRTIEVEYTLTEHWDASNGGTDTWTSSRQCWVDELMGWPVKCAYILTKDLARSSSGPYTISSSDELVSYDAPRFPGSSKSTIRFGGGWSATLSGADSGSCESIVIAISGEVTGSCSSTNAGSFDIRGSVDAQGNLQASAANGAMISGQLTPADGSGSWAMMHK